MSEYDRLLEQEHKRQAYQQLQERIDEERYAYEQYAEQFYNEERAKEAAK